MSCKLCQEKKGKFYKIKDGKICEKCYSKLPVFLRENLKQITATDLSHILRMLRSQEMKEKEWYQYGNIRFYSHCIAIQGTYIDVADIKNAKLTFIPRKEMSFGCFGEVSLILTLQDKYNEYTFRTLLVKDLLHVKTENGKLFVQYRKEMEQTLEFLQQGILLHSFLRVKDIYLRNQNANQNTYNRKQQESEQKSSASNTENLEDALKIYRLSIPFSASELKRRYRELILKCHPDQQNRDQSLLAEDVNRYYDFLKKYAN